MTFLCKTAILKTWITSKKKKTRQNQQIFVERKEKMEKVKKQAKIWLCIAIAMMLLSSVVVSAVQTDGGKVEMQELMVETELGYTMSAYLFIPENATAENPAPAVVVSHGYLNNKEMADAYYVELARRGFVVVSVDQPGHGDSDLLPEKSYSAVYEAVLMLSRLPYVDSSRIGVTGHSMGGESTNLALTLDNMNEEHLVAAMFQNCCFGIYTDDAGNYADVYGSRDIAILSPQHDEFYYYFAKVDGELKAPYMVNDYNLQSFLAFGEEAMRVVYNPDIIHPWSHFSARSTNAMMSFFNEALDAPNPLPGNDQVWQWKEAFNFVGVIGLVIFVCSFGTLLVYTPTFESLRADEPAKPVVVNDKKGKLWFWLSLAACALLSTLIYIDVLMKGTAMNVSQMESMGLGLWSTLCGVITIISMVICYHFYGKKNGTDLVAIGVKLPVKKLGLSALLAFVVVVVSYGCVFVADYFFYADFRLWTLAFKAFEAPILKQLPYGLLFLTFYVASSVATNCFNNNSIGGKFNVIIVGIFTAFPALVLPWIQYIVFWNTGVMPWPASNMHILWLFPIVLILFGATIINRVMYKATKNPYIPGLINAALVTILTITNTCTLS